MQTDAQAVLMFTIFTLGGVIWLSFECSFPFLCYLIAMALSYEHDHVCLALKQQSEGGAVQTYQVFSHFIPFFIGV